MPGPAGLRRCLCCQGGRRKPAVLHWAAASRRFAKAEEKGEGDTEPAALVVVKRDRPAWRGKAR
ncbi:hypothetical protein CBM2634_U200002 [Cupriavidus taiwanensis]|uniref:Uncharacterized protein n=1 Tax=Cupriavidus taiwanensis TaxID=164546 RepID=A0A375JDN3_9BURK|nr:hypothetical protein CBM2634_U200002 [Cupriavidus taiwanensis]